MPKAAASKRRGGGTARTTRARRTQEHHDNDSVSDQIGENSNESASANTTTTKNRRSRSRSAAPTAPPPSTSATNTAVVEVKRRTRATKDINPPFKTLEDVPKRARKRSKKSPIEENDDVQASAHNDETGPSTAPQFTEDTIDSQLNRELQNSTHTDDVSDIPAGDIHSPVHPHEGNSSPTPQVTEDVPAGEIHRPIRSDEVNSSPTPQVTEDAPIYSTIHSDEVNSSPTPQVTEDAPIYSTIHSDEVNSSPTPRVTEDAPVGAIYSTIHSDEANASPIQVTEDAFTYLAGDIHQSIHPTEVNSSSPKATEDALSDQAGNIYNFIHSDEANSSPHITEDAKINPAGFNRNPIHSDGFNFSHTPQVTEDIPITMNNDIRSSNHNDDVASSTPQVTDNTYPNGLHGSDEFLPLSFFDTTPYRRRRLAPTPMMSPRKRPRRAPSPVEEEQEEEEEEERPAKRQQLLETPKPEPLPSTPQHPLTEPPPRNGSWSIRRMITSTVSRFNPFSRAPSNESPTSPAMATSPTMVTSPVTVTSPAMVTPPQPEAVQEVSTAKVARKSTKKPSSRSSRSSKKRPLPSPLSLPPLEFESPPSPRTRSYTPQVDPKLPMRSARRLLAERAARAARKRKSEAVDESTPQTAKRVRYTEEEIDRMDVIPSCSAGQTGYGLCEEVFGYDDEPYILPSPPKPTKIPTIQEEEVLPPGWVEICGVRHKLYDSSDDEIDDGEVEKESEVVMENMTRFAREQSVGAKVVSEVEAMSEVEAIPEVMSVPDAEVVKEVEESEMVPGVLREVEEEVQEGVDAVAAVAEIEAQIASAVEYASRLAAFAELASAVSVDDVLAACEVRLHYHKA